MEEDEDSVSRTSERSNEEQDDGSVRTTSSSERSNEEKDDGSVSTNRSSERSNEEDDESDSVSSCSDEEEKAKQERKQHRRLRNDPTYIPKEGVFYVHDDRRSNRSPSRLDSKGTDVAGRRLIEIEKFEKKDNDEGCWRHDKFEELCREDEEGETSTSKHRLSSNHEDHWQAYGRRQGRRGGGQRGRGRGGGRGGRRQQQQKQREEEPQNMNGRRPLTAAPVVADDKEGHHDEKQGAPTPPPRRRIDPMAVKAVALQSKRYTSSRERETRNGAKRREEESLHLAIKSQDDDAGSNMPVSSIKSCPSASVKVPPHHSCSPPAPAQVAAPVTIDYTGLTMEERERLAVYAEMLREESQRGRATWPPPVQCMKEGGISYDVAADMEGMSMMDGGRQSSKAGVALNASAASFQPKTSSP